MTQRGKTRADRDRIEAAREDARQRRRELGLPERADDEPAMGRPTGDKVERERSE